MKFVLTIEADKGQDASRVVVNFEAETWEAAAKWAEVFRRQTGIKGAAEITYPPLGIEKNRNLFAAYAGVHEEVFQKAFEPDARPEAIRAVIKGESPFKRLETYLEWEGIVGYTQTIYDIATSAPAVKD